MTNDEIRIQAQPDTIPNRFRFLVDREVWPQHVVFVDAAAAADASPLAVKLFEIEGVTRVEFDGRFVKITQNGAFEWMTIAKQVGATIRTHLQAGEPVIHEGRAPELPAEEALRLKVEKILDQEINPQIAAHGGYVNVVDVQGKDIWVRMGGGCQGCGSAAATMTQGVERLIRDALPEVERIVDATDHQAGTNPYYAPSN
ncbi:MAG: NifU family protein [Planctomycetes bacterium]|nr:NifU family protein [Planctomycetota bacterium]MCB9891868.1 NifU family protein [Planctomycetota bacterium]MCB9919871.1 NifU family protein [Planctomycetota bacterium]